MLPTRILVRHSVKSKFVAFLIHRWHSYDAAAGIALANSYRDVITAVMCGSEIRLRHNRAVAVPLVRTCVTRLRAAGVTQPLTHQATWPEWCNEEFPGQLFPRCERWDDVASIVDFISQTSYSWWENRVHVSHLLTPVSPRHMMAPTNTSPCAPTDACMRPRRKHVQL